MRQKLNNFIDDYVVLMQIYYKYIIFNKNAGIAAMPEGIHVSVHDAFTISDF